MVSPSKGPAKRIRRIWSGVYSLLSDKKDGFSWIQFKKTKEVVQENSSREEKICSAVGSCPYGVLEEDSQKGDKTNKTKAMGIMINAFGRTQGLLFTRPL